MMNILDQDFFQYHHKKEVKLTSLERDSNMITFTILGNFLTNVDRMLIF